ncbi:putative serine/threonine protein kinase [Blattamonas nauphoetae]|uniref:Serine/threonine protein kinase n=1 Tax=Blattamonas nauphoetae TaxID=2049346 RepID=A0ABQ9Y7W6_9EUKA|nr:putative serine/threonine protein kinase [Blattamonas nauphoetae]
MASSIASVLKEFSSSKSDPSMIALTPSWNRIPLLIRDWDKETEILMCKLLDEITRILTFHSISGLSLTNKSALNSALSTLSELWADCSDPSEQPGIFTDIPSPLYKFIKTLGQGRFGSVHEVSKTPSDEHFAMKVLTFSSESDFEKNEHEIAKLAKNQHRNVVGFVEAIEGDNAHFVVLELCSNSLQSEMSENQKLGGKMDVVRVYRVMRDVLDGIAFLHSCGEIYGDLKGSNVLIGKDGIAKLGDFGGVVGTGTMKTSNTAECGTMQFWAPEFFKTPVRTGTEIGSAAGDMWAFGLLLLEMLTSRSWIVGGSSVEIEKSVLGFDIGRICEKEGIVGDLQILLSLLLSKNPSQRISSADLIRTNRLQSVLGPETPLSRFLTEELRQKEQEHETDTIRIQKLETESTTMDEAIIEATKMQELLIATLRESKEALQSLTVICESATKERDELRSQLQIEMDKKK